MRQPAIPKLSELSTAGAGGALGHLDRHDRQTPSTSGPAASCWPALWPGNSRSANLAALLPPPSASCASWRAPTSARSAQLNCRRHRQIFAPAP